MRTASCIHCDVGVDVGQVGPDRAPAGRRASCCTRILGPSRQPAVTPPRYRRLHAHHALFVASRGPRARRRGPGRRPRRRPRGLRQGHPARPRPSLAAGPRAAGRRAPAPASATSGPTRSPPPPTWPPAWPGRSSATPWPPAASTSTCGSRPSTRRSPGIDAAAPADGRPDGQPPGRRAPQQHGQLITNLPAGHRQHAGAGRDHPAPAPGPGQPEGPRPVGRAHGRRRAAHRRHGRGRHLPQADRHRRRVDPRHHVPPARAAACSTWT